MSIRDEALAAFEAARQAKVDAAKQHLLDTVLYHPQNGSIMSLKDLTVVHEDHDTGMFVFTGPEADVHLAVSGENVRLVEDRDGWTRLATVSTLSDLGAVLAGS